jgi:hypothetical protein
VLPVLHTGLYLPGIQRIHNTATSHSPAAIGTFAAHQMTSALLLVFNFACSGNLNSFYQSFIRLVMLRHLFFPFKRITYLSKSLKFTLFAAIGQYHNSTNPKKTANGRTPLYSLEFKSPAPKHSSFGAFFCQPPDKNFI